MTHDKPHAPDELRADSERDRPGTSNSGSASEPLDPARSLDDELMRPEWLERWRARIARNAALEQAYRLVVLVVGLAILAAGVAMLVFPGPGWAAIILGLVVLATEFRWAERLLEPIQRLVRRLAERATDPAARRQNLLLLAAFLAGCALLAWWYLERYGATLEPLPLF